MPRLSKDEKEIIDKTVEEIAEELEATQEEQAEIVATKEDFDKLESKAIEDLEQEYNEFCKKEKEVPIIVTNEDILNELKEIKGTTNGNWTQTLKLRGQV